MYALYRVKVPRLITIKNKIGLMRIVIHRSNCKYAYNIPVTSTSLWYKEFTLDNAINRAKQEQSRLSNITGNFIILKYCEKCLL
jgi:hypothetical protein